MRWGSHVTRAKRRMLALHLLGKWMLALDPSPEMVLPTYRLGLPTSVNPTWKLPHRLAQKYVF